MQSEISERPAEALASFPPLSRSFRKEVATKLIEDVVGPLLADDARYHADWASQVAQEVSDAVRSSIAPLWPRYKILAQCWIHEHPAASPGIHIASRALWNTISDAQCDVTFPRRGYVCVVSVTAIFSN